MINDYRFTVSVGASLEVSCGTSFISMSACQSATHGSPQSSPTSAASSRCPTPAARRPWPAPAPDLPGAASSSPPSPTSTTTPSLTAGRPRLLCTWTASGTDHLVAGSGVPGAKSDWSRADRTPLHADDSYLPAEDIDRRLLRHRRPDHPRPSTLRAHSRPRRRSNGRPVAPRRSRRRARCCRRRSCLLVVRHAGEDLGQDLSRLGERRLAVGIVGAPHHVVHADHVPQANADGVLLEAEHDVLAEEVARAEAVLNR